MNISLGLRKIGAVWGVVGVILLLGFAVFRLEPFAIELFEQKLNLWQVALLVVWCLVMGYSEGYKAFGKQFAPRVVARAQHLANKATWQRIVLAPIFCIGYFGATKKRIITSIVLVTGIVILIVAVHFAPQPWRGMIDVGVILGLVIGIFYLMLYGYRATQQANYIVDPEVPS